MEKIEGRRVRKQRASHGECKLNRQHTDAKFPWNKSSFFMSSANKWMWVWHTYTQYSAYKEQHNSHVFGDFIRSTFAVQMSRFFAWCAFFAGFNRLPANNNIVVGWQHFFALSIILLISIAETLNRLIGFDCLMLIKTQTETLRAHSSSISLNWYSWAVPICHSYSKFNLETDFSICAHCCLLNWKNKSGFKLIEYVKLCVCEKLFFPLAALCVPIAYCTKQCIQPYAICDAKPIFAFSEFFE